MRRDVIGDLLGMVIFPRRYPVPTGKAEDWWRGVMRRYANAEKKLEGSDWSWYVLTFDDGHRETTRLKVLRRGIISGMCPAIYRGVIFKRIVTFATFSHVIDIWPAF